MLAAALFGLVLAEVATAVAVELAGGFTIVDAVDSFTVTDAAIGVAFSACGVLLAWHRPRNPIGWLFLAGGVAYGTSAAAASLCMLGDAAGWSTLVLRLLLALFLLAWPWAGPCLLVALFCSPTVARPARAGAG